MTATVFTIGHSNHPLEAFIALLQQHAIACLCDVRSAPVSKYNPQFHRNSLVAALPEHGIAYLFLGKELGARSNDPECYVDGKVQYDRLAATPLFGQGLERVLQEAATRRIALMCAEKDPLDCHRTILVSRRLVERGCEVQHILADGALEPHAEAVRRLRRQLGIADADLFFSDEELDAAAYDKQGNRVAYQTTEDETAMRFAD
ncbi:MAG: DUF488 domain-containing protein [Candidatus Hydrogenedentales bacterium]